MSSQIKIPLLLTLAALLLCSFVTAEVSSSDKTQIQNQVTFIANYINNNNLSIKNFISPNAKTNLSIDIEFHLLRIEINLAGKKINFQQSISSYEYLPNDRVKVIGEYSAQAPGWNVKNMPDYYIFEKSGDSWLLVDTDFHQKISDGNNSEANVKRALMILLSIASIFLPLLLIIFIAFWAWMLIDCITRHFDDKTLWIILIILLGILGAILYFFIVRRKLRKQKQFSNPQTTNSASPRVQQIANWIKSNEAQGYTPEQLRNTLLQMGYPQNEVDEAIRYAR